MHSVLEPCLSGYVLDSTEEYPYQQPQYTSIDLGGSALYGLVHACMDGWCVWCVWCSACLHVGMPCWALEGLGLGLGLGHAMLGLGGPLVQAPSKSTPVSDAIECITWQTLYMPYALHGMPYPICHAVCSMACPTLYAMLCARARGRDGCHGMYEE